MSTTRDTMDMQMEEASTGTKRKRSAKTSQNKGSKIVPDPSTTKSKSIIEHPKQIALSLEKLDNAELRAKCVEYGLPNVPVTTSSRSVLLRKLLAVMLGSDVAAEQRKCKTMSSASCSPEKIALEKLDNAELRVKCQEYGLPNIPVTTSSRSVLIRKLLAVMRDRKSTATTTIGSTVAAAPRKFETDELTEPTTSHSDECMEWSD